MSIIETGKITTVLLFAVFVVASAYWISRSRKGHLPYLRRISVLDAIDELVGRATEMGSDVLFTVGMTSGFDPKYIQGFVAGLSTLRYVASKCAEQDTPLHSIIGSSAGGRAENVYLSDDAMRFGCLEAGKPEFFEKGCTTHFYGTRVGAGLGIAFRTINFASSIFVGSISSEAPWPELFQTRGVVNFGGTLDYPHLPETVVVSDYFMIGSEVLEAGAYLSKDPMTMASIAVEDYIKYIMLAVLAIGFILFTVGFTAIKTWIVT